MIAFCSITTGLCIAEGVLGIILLPDERLSFSAFLIPPAFGLLTVLTGLVMESRRELSAKQTLLRMFIQLLLIEGEVFGVNFLLGNHFTPVQAGIVAIEIAGIFVFVYFVMWLNGRYVAGEFNRRLAALQGKESNQGDSIYF